MPGKEIARGRACIVYDLGDGTVLRRASNPWVDVAQEARVMAHARDHGVPVPEVHRAEGTDLVLDLVPGPTMLADLMTHPERLTANARVLADLHVTLDAVPAPPGTPTTSPTAAGTQLLHLDLHPANVILSPDGPVLIDWTNARAGDRATDVAMSWLIIECLGVPEKLTADVEAARSSLARAFLAHVDVDAARTALVEARDLQRSDPATTPTDARRIDALLAREGL